MSEDRIGASAKEIDLNGLEVQVLDSVALKRLIDEVRNECPPVRGHAAYDRTYHRHNR